MSTLTVLATGCGAYMSVGVDQSAKITGGLAQPMKQTASTDPSVAKLAAADGVETTSTMEPAQGRTYQLEVGWGMSAFAIGLGITAHDMSSSTFDFSDMNSPRYATATGAVNLTWTALHWKMLSGFVHAGPTMGVLVERTSGSYYTGKGLRFGAGVAAKMSVLTVFLDFAQSELDFADGPAQGMSKITGATIGIGLNR